MSRKRSVLPESTPVATVPAESPAKSLIPTVFPHEYLIHVAPDLVRTIRDPFNSEVTIYHVYPKVADFSHGQLPDDVNPRSHEKLAEKVTGRVPEAIKASLIATPRWFHLL